jgi:3-oxochol-4-en-24-oyl-CoA dehydrogenase
MERYMSAVELVALLDRYPSGGAALAPAVSELIAVERAIRSINLREVERAVLGTGSTAAGNLTKLAVAEHTQTVTELAIRIAGPAGVTGQEPDVIDGYLYNRAMTIAGGTSEITRNVIAERTLGLPREPQPAPAATR